MRYLHTIAARRHIAPYPSKQIKGGDRQGETDAHTTIWLLLQALFERITAFINTLGCNPIAPLFVAGLIFSQ